MALTKRPGFSNLKGFCCLDKPLTLSLYPEALAICQLPSGSSIPTWATASNFFAITRTPDELSIVCPAPYVPHGISFEGPWHALKVEGPLDFSLTGILAGLSGCLADIGISLFAISTFDTDYILVHDGDLAAAQDALRAAGYRLL